MNIILADDHTLFRDALAHYLKGADPDLDILMTHDINGVFDLLSGQSNIDLVMVDLRMPGMNGVQGIEKLNAAYPEMPIILLSGTAEEEDIRAAMKKGASGFFPKTMSGKTMLQAIYKVVQGEKFLPLDRNTDTVMPSYYADPFPEISRKGQDMSPAVIASLTPREKQVLDFLLRGVSNKEIAQSLDLQVVTVKLHVRGICRKLGAKNRTQAALMAQQGGLPGRT